MATTTTTYPVTKFVSDVVGYHLDLPTEANNDFAMSLYQKGSGEEMIVGYERVRNPKTGGVRIRWTKLSKTNKVVGLRLTKEDGLRAVVVW